MNISVVIPLLNEEESLPELHRWMIDVLEKEDYSYEILFIDDGSTDQSWDVIRSLSSSNPNTKGIRLLKNYGKSQALHAGFNAAQGEVIVTMDADLQDFPDEIPSLYKMIINEGFDLVSGWKKIRHDSVLFKNIPSKLFNVVARKTSGIRLHDFNCGLKAYKKEVIKNIEVKGEMHRYIPILAKNEGFRNITEKEVKHQSRKHGVSKFGPERFTNGFLDLISLWFFNQFGKRPMHFFGTLGILMFTVGFLAAFWIGSSKMYKLWNNLPANLVTENPWFYISLTAMILGSLLFTAGFLGELILSNGNNKDRYTIKEYTT